MRKREYFEIEKESDRVKKLESIPSLLSHPLPKTKLDSLGLGLLSLGILICLVSVYLWHAFVGSNCIVQSYLWCYVVYVEASSIVENSLQITNPTPPPSFIQLKQCPSFAFDSSFVRAMGFSSLFLWLVLLFSVTFPDGTQFLLFFIYFLSFFLHAYLSCVHIIYFSFT